MEPSTSSETVGATGNSLDRRLEVLRSYVIKSLRLKHEKWTRIMTLEEHKTIIKEYLDNSTCMVLVIVLTPAAQLVPFTTFPLMQLKTKGVYFIKKDSQPIPFDECDNFVIEGDLASRTIDQMSALVEEIFVPLLSYEENQKLWPSMIVQDVQKHVHNLKSIVNQVKGQMSGETILAMPVGIEKMIKIAKEITETRNCTIDLYLKSAIEGAVITWATQIHDILKESPNNAFQHEQRPTPRAELLFWNNRLKNLSFIYHQLCEKRIKAMALILENSYSAYYTCFQKLFKDLVTALAEAKDVTLYLNPFESIIQALEEIDFAECKPLLIPLMHILCTIWANSVYYCHSSKIIVLLKQICNLIINQTRRYLDPSSIFHSDVDEIMQRLTLSIDIFKFFRALFDYYNEILPQFFKEPEIRPPVLWTFHLNSVFRDFNAFVERLNSIQCFFRTVNEFFKLEKIEIGGLRGRQLGARISAVFAEFNQLFTAFASKAYDVLDPDDRGFDNDFGDFQNRIFELDMKLAAIFCQAFDCCHNLESIFKLINIVGSVLERPRIKKQFTRKYKQIILMLDEELSACETIFSAQMEMRKQDFCLFRDWNCPPTATTLRWCNQLKARISGQMNNFKNLQHRIINSERALDIKGRYDRLMDNLDICKKQACKNLSASLPDQIESKLSQPLLARDPQTKSLILNFGPELICILYEVHYLSQMKIEGLPEIALEFSSKNEMFRLYALNLEKTVEWYNRIQENSTSVELKLVDSEIQEIDDLVQLGINKLVWNSEGIMAYLEKLREPVAKLKERINHTHENLQKIKDIMSPWAKQPLFERKDSKKESVLSLDERSDRTERRYADIRRASDVIHKLVYENLVHFQMLDRQNDDAWLNYIDYVDNIIYENMLLAIGISAGYLAENMDPDNDLPPLFESRLELVGPDLKFIPSLSPEDPFSFNNALIELMRDIMKMGTLIKRLNPNEKSSYSELIQTDQDIIDLRREILNGVDLVMREAFEFCHQFERYSYLWLDDRHECMKYFLEFGRFLSNDEIELVELGDPGAPQPNSPSIEEFREQIDHYESLYSEIDGISPFQIFNSWFRVDVRPFRQALLNSVCKWGNMFKNHLVTCVTTSLMDLSSFIREADEGLLQTINEGDYKGLVSSMAYLMQVKERTHKTDEMFQPLQETIRLLKYYDMDIQEKVNVLLQELPEQWENTKKIATTVKQQLSPLQAIEVVRIRNKIADFEKHLQDFREVFKHYKFFHYDCQEPYILIDRIDGDIWRLESVMHDIQESGCLFEVNVPEFKLLKQCRKELRMLKVGKNKFSSTTPNRSHFLILQHLWDYVYIVQFSIEEWKTTPWRKVDVENMDIECKKFAKDIRLLDKEMRSWDTFISLESTVKNMLTSLRAVAELQNPAIRERHWNQLMNSTKVVLQLLWKQSNFH